MTRCLAALIASIVFSTPALAVPVQWTTGAGANGHYYDVVAVSRTWAQARDAAAATSFAGQSGHLVTITSAAENAFIMASLDARFDGFAWIGASDEAVEGQWRWMVGPEAGIQFSQGNAHTAPFNYDNWGGVEPNDSGNEDVAALNMGTSGGIGAGPGQWGDTKTFVAFNAYVVEYSTPAIPEPQTYALLLAGLLLLTSTAIRRQRSRTRPGTRS